MEFNKNNQSVFYFASVCALTMLIMISMIILGNNSPNPGPSSVFKSTTTKLIIPSGNPKEGHAIFTVNCVACHQADGHGKPGMAPSIRNRDFLAIASDHFIVETVQKGRVGTSMAPRPDLSLQQISHIISYLRTLEVTVPVSIKVDPTIKYEGDKVTGKIKYDTYCASCHGAKGEGYLSGGAGPGIGLKGFLDVASDDYIFKTVKHGRIGTAMRSFIGAKGVANLNEQDVKDIITHLRALSSNEVVDEVVETPDVTKGKLLFTSNCGGCHQPDGSGKPGLAPSIRNRDFLAIATDDLIRHTIKNGRIGTTMVGRPDLSDNSIGHIIAYLRNVKVAIPVSIEVNDKLHLRGDPVAGSKKYSIYCASCHGVKGEGYLAGGAGPGIGLKGFLDSVSDDYIYQTLKQGRIGTAMKSFIGAKGVANLTKQDASDIITHLRKLN